MEYKSRLMPQVRLEMKLGCKSCFTASVRKMDELRKFWGHDTDASYLTP